MQNFVTEMWDLRNRWQIGAVTIWDYSIIDLNTLRPRQNGRHFPDDIFKHILLNGNIRTFIQISLKFVPKGPINNISALVQMMAWHRLGDKPLSEPMMIILLTHICVTQPQWVNSGRMMGKVEGWDTTRGTLARNTVWYQLPSAINRKLVFVYYIIQRPNCRLSIRIFFNIREHIIC